MTNPNVREYNVNVDPDNPSNGDHIILHVILPFLGKLSAVVAYNITGIIKMAETLQAIATTIFDTKGVL